MTSLRIMLRGNGIEVLGFIDAAHASTGLIHVDLIDAARLLSRCHDRPARRFRRDGARAPCAARWPSALPDPAAIRRSGTGPAADWRTTPRTARCLAPWLQRKF